MARIVGGEPVLLRDLPNDAVYVGREHWEYMERKHVEADRLRRCLVRVHDVLQRGERDASLNEAVIASALDEIEKGGYA